MICLWSGPPGFNCWISFDPAFQCWSCCWVPILFHDVCSCHVLRILPVDMCRIGDVCCLPAPAHQPFSSSSLDLSAPKEAYSRNVRASGTLKFGYEDVFKSHVSNEPWFICLLFWFIDELEVLHADRKNCVYMNHSRTRGEGCARKTGLSPSVIYYGPFQCGACVVIYSNCQCSSAFCWSLTYCSFYLG